MIRIDNFNCIEIEDYKGNKNLILGYEKKDGSFGVKWCKQEFGKGNWKDVPVKIPLGDKEQAIATLQTLVSELQEDGGCPF